MLLLIQKLVLVGDLRKAGWGLLRSPAFFTKNLRLTSATYAGKGLSRIQASTDMQRGPLGLSCDFDQSSNVGVDLPRYRSATVSKTWR